MKNILIIFTLIFFFACKPTETKVVHTDVNKYLSPVTIIASTGLDLGEMEASSDIREITLSVTNNSEGPYSKLALTIPTGQNYLKFLANDTGENKTPGKGGTCGVSLSAGASCTYKLSFAPVKLGHIKLPVNLTYNNYIQPDSQSITFVGLIGEPADLAFSGDITSYDFGVVEQTSDTEKLVTLEIVNNGELTAREIVPSMFNGDPLEPYNYINSCPATLAGKAKCSIKIIYRPKNNAPTDLPVTYTGSLTIDYLKNPEDLPGKITSKFTFLSTRIEADFTPVIIKSLTYSSLVVGNKEAKEFTIQNIGYRAGTIQSLLIGNNFECSKNTSGIILKCLKSGVPVTQEEFPFFIEDTNSCFGKNVEGVEGKVPGESCSLKVTFWPSINNTTGGTFSASDVFIKYDSRWLGSGGVNLTTKKIATIPLTTYLGVGRFALDHVELTPPGLPKLPNIMPDVGALLEASLGDVDILSASVNTATIFYTVKIVFKNIGNSIAKVNKIEDGAATPLTIIPGVTAALSAGYYLKVKESSCASVAANGTCNVTYNLAPTAKATTIIENEMMYDFIDSIIPSLNYKKFKLTYSNGSTIDNQGFAVVDQNIESHIKSNLVHRGFLVIDSPASIRYVGVAGETADYTIKLKNIGTGDLLIAASANQMFNPLTPINNNWAWQFINNPADIDDCGIYNSTDKILAPNTFCNVTVRAKLPDTSRITSLQYYLEFNRSFVDQGEMISTSLSNANIFFNYCSVPSVGCTQSSTNTILLNSSYSAEANIVPQKPEPNMSAVLYRPAITYNTLSVVYPQAIALPSKTISEAYFDSNTYPYVLVGGVPTRAQTCPATLGIYTYEDCWNPFFKSSSSINHVKNISNANMPIVSGEYIVHAGTFPVGQTAAIKFGFMNSGKKTATNIQLVADADSTPVSGITTSSTLLTTLGAATATPQIQFIFAPTSAGIFSRCYSLNYKSGRAIPTARSTRVCIYAEAVLPDLIAGTNLVKIQYSDDYINYTDITSPFNSVDNSLFANFFVVNGSNVKLKKRFKITNNRNVAINNLNYYILTTSTAPPKNLTGVFPSPYVKLLNGTTTPAIDLAAPVVEANPSCILGMTLLSGASCLVDITYEPTEVDGLWAWYFGVNFEVVANQYLSYTGGLHFRSAPPTKLTVVNLTFQNPITPVAQDISAYNIATDTKTSFTGSYAIAINKDPTNPKKNPLVLTNADSSTTFDLRIANSTTLKTSFMPAWLLFNPTLTPADFPASQEILIFHNSTADIVANRACFYGDDEGDPAIPILSKGFDKNSQNICRTKIIFSGYRTFSSDCDTQYMGGSISNGCNPFTYSIPYSTTDGVVPVNDNLNLHMEGFMESNRIVSDAFNLDQEVSAKSDGSVRIAVPAILPNHANRGAVEVGLICYDKDYLKLKSDTVFDLINDYTYTGGVLNKISNPSVDIENCVPFTNEDTYVTVAGLTPGSYYFFRVFAFRSFNSGGVNEQNLRYVSKSTILTLTVAIPNSTQVYDHLSKQLIDKSIQPIVGTRTSAINTCALDSTPLDIVGVPYNAFKNLINTPVFNYLIAHPDSSVGYPLEGIGAVTHWLSDNAYDISSAISLYNGASPGPFPGYSITNLDGTDMTYKASYHQACNNNASCSSLYKLVGGDPGQGLYFEGVFYTTADGANAAIRCYAELLCPTNPLISINAATCLNP